MIAIFGFIALHAVFVALGGSALWALGFVDPLGEPRAALWALGPAYVVGVALLMPWLVIVLLLHIPVTFATAAIVALLGICLIVLVGIRLGRLNTTPAVGSDGGGGSRRRFAAGFLSVRTFVLLGVGGFVVWGMLVMAKLPTGGDDARIWSIRGLTLDYYGRLVPEIFQNQGQAGAHPVYPLLQPELEAIVSQSFGHAAPSFFHAELWLLFICCVWTAGYLLWRAPGLRGGIGVAVWLPPLAVLAVVPIEVSDLIIGDADTTGSVFLALGIVCAGLWLADAGKRYLALAAIMLTAAASTKDEDLLAAGIVCVILVIGTAIAAATDKRRWRTRERLLPLLGLIVYFAVLIAPWRLWLSKHHLTDGVQPPFPKALNPAYFFGRGTQLNETVTAMISQTLGQWGWLLAIFLVVCGVCIASPHTRRIASFYLTVFCLVVLGLIWLYTTTRQPLSFLIPTSMNRTVAVFMAMTPVAMAHMLATLATAARPMMDGISPAITRSLSPTPHDVGLEQR